MWDESVGSLYSVNTFGSGTACLLAAIALMRVLGESGCVRLAACVNLVVGSAALLLCFRPAPPDQQASSIAGSDTSAPHKTIRFEFAMLLAAATGFIALAYEIVWYRLFSFASGGSAPCFANLLAYYLFGIAYGALAVHDACKKKLRNDLGRTLRACATVVMLGSIAAFLLGPIVCLCRPKQFPTTTSMDWSRLLRRSWARSFPILVSCGDRPRGSETGKKLSYLYLSNIVGSALGSFLVGFVILNHWSTRHDLSASAWVRLALRRLLRRLATPRPSKIAVLSALARFCPCLRRHLRNLFSEYV